MRWLAHQAHGFFGFSPGETPQPRWHGTMDIEEAFTAAGDVREAFFRWMSWPDSPPLSGGVLDAWPARLAEGLAFARREWKCVQAYVSHTTKKG